MTPPQIFVGVDVQAVRACAYAVLDERGDWLGSGWVPGTGVAEIAAALRGTVEEQARGDASRVAVGMDAPRMPLAMPRAWYWDRSKSSWRERLPSDRGHGRHCEVVVAAHRIARPQWTPPGASAPGWMQLGFALFRELAAFPHVYEVFPSASYTLLSADKSARFELCLQGFARGPKDMLDAHVAALTAHEYVQGRGQAVGGGDGLGQIILPRRLAVGLERVLQWPEL
jgi:hypothetical protein